MLGSTGELHVKYPDELPSDRGLLNPDERITTTLQTGFYNKGMKDPKLPHVYKQ